LPESSSNFHFACKVSRQGSLGSEATWSTRRFSSRFLNEQIEEEKSVRDMLDRLTLVGDDPAGLLVMDREAGTRQTPKEGVDG